MNEIRYKLNGIDFGTIDDWPGTFILQKANNLINDPEFRLALQQDHITLNSDLVVLLQMMNRISHDMTFRIDGKEYAFKE